MPLGARRSHLALVLVAAIFALGLTGCGGEPKATKSPKPPDHMSVIATAKGKKIPIYGEADGKPKLRLPNPTDAGADRVFLVRGGNGEGWIKVLLPIRPNGSTGWVRAEDVTLSKTTYRVHISLSEHRFVLMHGDEKAVVSGPIAVGKEHTPTPDGDYYIVSLLETPKKNSTYGPYAFGLSGFSGVLETFEGGPARIGIHGTNKPKLLGEDVSHGCIRISNKNVTKLAQKLPLGTPVYVHA